MRSVVLMVLGGLVLISGLAAVNLRQHSRQFEINWQLIQRPPLEVELAQPERSEVVETVTARGKVEPVEEAEIAPQVVGRVIAVHVEDGDRVEAGNLLVQLDPTAAQAQLDSAEARIERLRAAIADAEEDVEKAARDLARTQSLAARNVATPTAAAQWPRPRPRYKWPATI